MKKTLFILAAFFISSLNAQEPISFEKVIQTENVGKDILYTSVQEWMVTYYKSAKDVIQYTDKESGLITGNANFKYSYSGLSYLCYEGWVSYTIKVYIKDDRFKVVFTDFRHKIKPGNQIKCQLGLITDAENPPVQGAMKKAYDKNVWDNIKSEAEAHATIIFYELQTHTSNLKSGGSDWDF